MSARRRVKQGGDGRNQDARIPCERELSGEGAILRNDDNQLVVESAPPQSLLEVLAALEPLDEAVPPIPGLRMDPVDL